MEFLYGHRGASQSFPENTMPAFQAAVDGGANALETDVRITADGEVLIFHDSTATRMAGHSKKVEEHNLSEVQQWDVGWGFQSADGSRPYEKQGYSAPTLRSVLEAFPSIRFNIDIKEGTKDGTQRVYELVESLNASSRVLLTSFHSRTRDQLLELGYKGPTGLGKRDSLALVFLPELLLKKKFRPGDRAQLPPTAGPLNLSSPKFISKAHRLGLQVDFWTINDTPKALALLAAGADGIMSDCPEKLAPDLSPMLQPS